MNFIGRLLDAASASTTSFCETVLMMPVDWDTPPTASRTIGPQRHIAVALTNEDVAMQVGLVADWNACADLVRVLLALPPQDPIADQDITDRMGEVMSLVTGGVKTRLSNTHPQLKIGLPVVHGDGLVRQSRNVCVASRLFSVGNYQARLMVMLQEQIHQSPTLPWRIRERLLPVRFEPQVLHTQALNNAS